MYRTRHSDACFPQAGSSPPRLARHPGITRGPLPASCSSTFPSTGQIHQTRKPSASPINTPRKQPPSPSHAHMLRSWTSLVPFSMHRAQKKFTPRSWGSCPPVANPTSVPRETAGCADVVFSPRTQCPPPGSNCVIKTLVLPAISIARRNAPQHEPRTARRSQEPYKWGEDYDRYRKQPPSPWAHAPQVSPDQQPRQECKKKCRKPPRFHSSPFSSEEQRADRQTLPAATPCPTGKHPWIRTSREQAEGSRLQAVA